MLLISDLHFTDKVQDEYRWDVFDFVRDYYGKTEDKNLIIMGDLTDSKDHHSAVLVNRIVYMIRQMVEIGMEVFILKGNHDYIDPDQPFFEFLEQIEYVRFIKHPSCILIQGEKCLFLPHTRNPIDEWETDIQIGRWAKECNLVFMHQSVIGSVTSNGYLMEEGLRQSYFKRFNGTVFSGDIHLPQKCGPVTYVGSPYSIRFNDHFDGRAIALTTHESRTDTGRSVKNSRLWANEMFTKLGQRRTINIEKLKDLKKSDARPGDQVKVVLTVKKDKVITRMRVEDACKELGFELCSFVVIQREKYPLRKKEKTSTAKTPGEVVRNFGVKQGLNKAHIKTGEELVQV